MSKQRKSGPHADDSAGQIALPLPDVAGEGIPEAPRLSMTHEPFSDYIVYVDESGDHGMSSGEETYPIFVLAFCVFNKRHYMEKVVTAVERFKFRHFGHDAVVLHEHEIRKETGPFRFDGRAHKDVFLDELTGIIETSKFVLISSVIDKRKLRERATPAENPYHIALGSCLEALHDLMREKGQADYPTHVVVECRGDNEDRDLELEFRRLCDGANRRNERLPFRIVMAHKRSNSSGLQLADLVARPIGLSILRPNQSNRAFEVLKPKFFCSGGRRKAGEGYDGWGLRVHP